MAPWRRLIGARSRHARGAHAAAWRRPCPGVALPPTPPPRPLHARRDGARAAPCPQEYTICVADGYWCDYYCKYSPTWYFAMVAKGEKVGLQSPLVAPNPVSPETVF